MATTERSPGRSRTFTSRRAPLLALVAGLAVALASTGAAATGQAEAAAFGSGGEATPQARKPKPKRPTIVPHRNVRAEATSQGGANVKYGRAVVRRATSVRYSKATGTLFRLGTTTVTIVAKNRGGTSRSKFTVTVVDTTPPAFGAANDVTATATSFTGANVTFPAITATDRVDSNPAVTCSAASGSLFAVGTTNVSCSARDTSGNTATGGFRVIINLWPALAADRRYTGTTSQGKTISFTVTGGGYYVMDITAAMHYSCTPPATFDGTWTPLPTTRFGIPPSGSFSLGPITGNSSGSGVAGTNTTSFTASFTGAATVTGTLSSTQSLTAPGSYQCSSGTVTWTAS